MPSDPRKRQKKQERRTAKRKAKQHQLTKEKHAGLPERLASATRYPVLHCWTSQDLWTQGIGWVGLSRELPNGQIAYCLFLLDRYCLGVKNVIINVTGRFTYESQVERKVRADHNWKELSPATARRFLESAVDYARSLGFHPHPDYKKAMLIFGEIDPTEATEELEFGKDGKPFYISGPNESEERSLQIMRTLEQNRGSGRYDYLVRIPEGSAVIPPSLNHEGGQMIGPGEMDTIGEDEDDFADEEDEA